jgi:hypothetical protein
MVSMVIAQNLTDSMNTNDDMGFHPGSDTCPSCKSDQWNGAINVAMESTTDAKITFIASANNVVKLYGGIREALLSDRWFSWDHPIEADIGLSANTGLVQEVKRFMVEYGPAVQMPSPPAEPVPSTSMTDMSESIEQRSPFAQAPMEPTPSGIMEETVVQRETGNSSVSSMLVRFLMVTVPLMVGLICANAFFGYDILAVLPVLLFFPLIMIIATFKTRNRTTTLAEDEDGFKDREKRPVTIEHYTKDIEKSREETERFRIRYEEFERKLREYTRLLNEAAIYERQLAEYEIQKISVLKARELLWERTRLCTRCGTAYLGPG